MNNKKLMLTGVMAMVGVYLGDALSVAPRKKPHWKETQSKEDKEHMLQKAQAKRDRKKKR